VHTCDTKCSPQLDGGVVAERRGLDEGADGRERVVALGHGPRLALLLRLALSEMNVTLERQMRA
jgi:hypothetical protein